MGHFYLIIQLGYVPMSMISMLGAVRIVFCIATLLGVPRQRTGTTLEWRTSTKPQPVIGVCHPKGWSIFFAPITHDGYKEFFIKQPSTKYKNKLYVKNFMVTINKIKIDWQDPSIKNLSILLFLFTGILGLKNGL